MSGLLDKRTRILDFIITDVGKQELTKGELTFEYATFSDLNAQYSKDPNFDHTQLVTFEASSIPSDLFIFDLENNGKILSTNMSQGPPENVSANMIALGSITDGVSIEHFNNFINNTITPLKNHFNISNIQQFIDRDEFIISPLNTKFNVSDIIPIPIGKPHIRNLNALPNIFQDPDFKTKQNFKFLPPINSNNTPVFKFDDITAGSYHRTAKEVVEDLSKNPKDNQNTFIQFEETSTNNNLIIQFFEKNVMQLNKLKIVAHESEDSDNDTNVYFIGKTFKDIRGVESFIKIFTLIILK